MLDLADGGASPTASTTDVPRVGWAQSLPVTGLEAWENVQLAEKGLTLVDLTPLADRAPERCVSPSEETFTLFRGHGLVARECAGRGAAATDRHSHWPGLWVSAEQEFGPSCSRSR
ncbi:hypothetical protein ACFYUH_22215 [Streptomyces fimicarius]|uniref:hypothetical protein n=1 Tax=Streptomyces griseus TaxID=1911 RepID=UPI00367E3C77